jgi:ribosomal protein S18 acetylase RimI-like enzyme
LAAYRLKEIMKALHTTDPNLFLKKIQPALEQDEAANQAMLTLCEQLIDSPAQAQEAAMVWTEDAQGVTAAALLLPPNPLYLFCEPLTKAPSLRLLINMLRDVSYRRVKGKNHAVESYAILWGEFFKGSAKPAVQEKVFRLAVTGRTPFAAGYMRRAVLSDVDQLQEWFSAYKTEVKNSRSMRLCRETIEEEIEKDNIFVWEDGLMVSMISKTLSTRHGAGLDHLYTPQMLRGRGYATILTNSLCRQLLQEGNSFCSITTDPTNQVSSHLLQKLGFTFVCDLTEIELIK